MRTLILLIFMMAAISCGNNTAPDAGTGDFSGFDLIDVPGSDVQMAVRKNAEGKILEKGFVINGIKDGLWITYHGDENNFPQSIASYVNGIKNGPTYKLTNRGQIEETTNYFNNNLDGLYAQYNFGRPKLTTEYKNGAYDGKHTEYFNNGKPQKVIEFKDGKQDGLLQYFNENGDVTLEYEYKDGKKVSGGMVE